jgi:MarR family 2-MHQ and catechol resistance regulon transcriptional repressor
MPTHYEGTTQEILALDTLIKLSRAADSVGSRLANGGTMGDLTPSQFGVLESLYHLGPLRQGEISAKLLKSGGNITRVVDNLEKRGLVKRERSECDRRVITVSLAPAGEQLIEHIFPGHVAAIVGEMRILTQQEQETLGRLCRILGKQQRE